MMLGMKLKENARKIFVLSALTVFIMLIASQDCRADSVSNNGLAIEFGVPTIKRVTCYLPTGNNTCTGATPIPNYTIGSDKRLLGCVVMFYQVNDDGSIGDFITMGEVQDTGSHPRIKGGNSFDVFQQNMDDAKAWIKANGDFVYCVVYDGKG